MRSGSESTLDTILPTSAASTKRERNRRKKENAKKRKAEELKNKADEAEVLAGMGTMALNERVLGGRGSVSQAMVALLAPHQLSQKQLSSRPLIR